jgi:hypothetical protein
MNVMPVSAMARYVIPKGAGTFEVLLNRAGGYTVTKGKLRRAALKIPCRDLKHAREIADRLNRGDHDGQLWV